MLPIRFYDLKLSLGAPNMKGQSWAAPFEFGFAKPQRGRTDQRLVLNSRKESNMREWHKPTIEETESGMEVTSYLPAELDRA